MITRGDLRAITGSWKVLPVRQVGLRIDGLGRILQAEGGPTMGTSETAPDAVQEFWDDRYREKPRIWSGKVNPVLAAAAAGAGRRAGARPGLGRGRRRHLVRPARLGRDRRRRVGGGARARCGQRGRGRRRRPDHAGSTTTSGRRSPPAPSTWCRPSSSSRRWTCRASTSSGEPPSRSRPVGAILSVSHAAAPSWAPPAMHQHRFPTPEEERDGLALDPAEWDIVRCEVVERDGTGPDGQTGVLLDAVILAERRERLQSPIGAVQGRCRGRGGRLRWVRRRGRRARRRARRG